MMIDNMPSMGSERQSKGVIDSFHSQSPRDDEESKNALSPDDDVQEHSYDFKQHV